MPRYKLRTLLIVLAIVATASGWVGSQFRTVATRRAIIRGLEERGDVILYTQTPKIGKRLVEGDRSKGVSSLRRWLGDENETGILFLEESTSRQAAIWAFPEADIYVLE